MTPTKTYARVWFDSWAGRFTVPCEVLGTCTRKGKPHYKVRLLAAAMRHPAGAVLYPPRSSVTNVSSEQPTDLSNQYKD